MKKNNLKLLKLDKQTISKLNASKIKGGTVWEVSERPPLDNTVYEITGPIPLVTNEGPCEGGTAGCVVDPK